MHYVFTFLLFMAEGVRESMESMMNFNQDSLEDITNELFVSEDDENRNSSAANGNSALKDRGVVEEEIPSWRPLKRILAKVRAP